MSTLQDLREGLSEAWDSLIDGWQRLYRQAASAMTRFTPGRKGDGERAEDAQDIAVRSAGWGVLAAEVFDAGDSIVVRMEAPGMEKADFEIQVLDDRLIVQGEKRIERERTDGRYHLTECAYGSFQRAIPLPEDVETDKAHARYNNGVLRVELPKAVPQRRSKVTIDVQ